MFSFLGLALDRAGVLYFVLPLIGTPNCRRSPARGAEP